MNPADLSDADALTILDQLVALHKEAHPTDGAIMLADSNSPTDRHTFIMEASDRLREAFLRMQEQGLIMIAPGRLNSFIRVTGPESVYKHSHCNYHEILQSDTAGCFYCLRIFQAPFEFAHDWEEARAKDCFEVITEPNGEQTIVCSCWVDSVIGSASGLPITTELLQQMHNYWFKEREDGNGLHLSG